MAVVAATTAVAAEASLATLSDAMTRTTFENAHDLAGLVIVLGFLAALVPGKLGG